VHLHVVCIHHLPHNLQAKHCNTNSNTAQMQPTTAILKHGSEG
jgi:hypothetical protein